MVDEYSKVHTLRHTDWSGGQCSLKSTLLKDNQSQILKDASLDQKGTLYPCYGHPARYTSPGADKVDGLGYYEKANGDAYLIVAIGTSIYYDDLSLATPVLTLIDDIFTASDVWSFTVFKDVLYITNGKDTVRTWDGTTLVTLPYNYAGTKQTITVEVVGTITLAGDATVTVGSPRLTAPAVFSVHVDLADTAEMVATKIRESLLDNDTPDKAAIIALYMPLSAVGSVITFESRVPVDNEEYWYVDIENDTCTGLGAPNVVTTQGGSAPSTYIFTHLEAYNNRLWGVEADTSRVRWSKILVGTTWDALDFMDFTSDADTIKRILRLGSYLSVNKRRSKAILTGDTTSNYAQTWLDGAGTVSQKAVTLADKYLSYVSYDGAHLTDLVTDVLVSLPLDDEWSARINKDALSKIAIVNWRSYVLVALPVDGATENNEVWSYDLRSKAWVVLTHLPISSWTKGYVNGDEVVFGADSTKGQVYQILKYGQLTHADGSLVQYHWKSKDWTFGAPEKYKLFKNIYLELEGVAQVSRLDMWIHVDNEVHEVNSLDIGVPDGEGMYRNVRLIPPIYGAVLGRKMSVELIGQVGVRSVVVEYSFRSDIPPGGVI